VKLNTARGVVDLGYCTNVHPGETLDEVLHHLANDVSQVKADLGLDGPLGIGLRLSGRAAEELEAPRALDRLRRQLDASGLYVFTLNAFPYGDFHGTKVKERVYLPDWLDDRRLHYTNRMARILATLLPAGAAGCVSTVPGAFRTRAASNEARAAIADRFVSHARMLNELRSSTDRAISLAIEPEPGCVLETTKDVAEFFERFITPRSTAEERAPLAVCLDACHAAVELEGPNESVGRLTSAGIPIAKVQISAGLEASPTEHEVLRAFDDGVYLHQVVAWNGHEVRSWVDLDEALLALRDSPANCRVHCHVPIFTAHLGALQTTQPHLVALLEAVRARSECSAFEVETYTWNVLPDGARSTPLVEAIAREVRWAKSRLLEA
jgi:sugar phosphate isomerase/epimerase